MHPMKAPFTSQSFSTKELESALSVAYRATQTVAPMLQKNFGASEYSAKRDEQDWVTEWDRRAEACVIKDLSAFTYDIGILGEESGIHGSEDVYWTIDPIDGTSHYVRGADMCTTMIALVDHGIPVAAVIHDFVRGDTYTAIAGSGAFKNFSKRLRVSSRPVEASHIELYTNTGKAEGQKLRTAIENTGAHLLSYAASGHMLISVARGTTEGFMSAYLPDRKEWDIAPGALLVHEAGGIVRNVGSDSFSSRNPDIIAANPLVFGKLAESVGNQQAEPQVALV